MIIVVTVSGTCCVHAAMINRRSAAQDCFRKTLDPQLRNSLLPSSSAKISFKFSSDARVWPSGHEDYMVEVMGIDSPSESMAQSIARTCNEAFKCSECQEVNTECIIDSGAGMRVSASARLILRSPTKEKHEAD